MKIKKIFNQNAILVNDNGQEKVAIGKGLGFNRKQNDLIFNREIERLFILEPSVQACFQKLLNQIDEKYLLVAEEIVAHAELILEETLNQRVLIALTDHISFAAENLTKGIVVRNKLLREIEVLYAEEFRIAQWAVDYLTTSLKIPFTYDQAGYIAIHLHSNRSNRNNNHQSMRDVTIVSDIIHFIEAELKIDLHDQQMSLDYTRLVNHLRLLLQRYQNQQYAVLDNDILAVLKNKYPASYEITKKIRVLLLKQHQLSIASEEMGYLVIHIERLRSSLYGKNI
ncbi:MAG: PRD domain-containing protein [Enterococcus sp.]